MKLIDDLKKYSKDYVYEAYLKVTEEPKYYEKITKKKMIEEIINVYNQKNYIFSLCTKKELNFLKIIMNKKLSINEHIKYDWEIKTLCDKNILCYTDFKVYDEFVDNVKDALKYYAKYPDMNIHEIIVLMIALIRTNGELLTKALEAMITDITNISQEGFNKLLGSPLFRFYCSFKYTYIPSLNREEECIYYIDYWDILDELSEKRQEYGLAGAKGFILDDYYDLFYYGITVKNNKNGQKLLKELDNTSIKWFMLKAIDEIRLLHNYALIDYICEDNLHDLVIKTLDDTPCGVMNGFTPNEYIKEKDKEKVLNYKFTIVPQNNAHLCRRAADEYYKLYLGLIEYINTKEKINPDLVVYKQSQIHPIEIQEIDEYLWKNKDVIIPEFIKNNPLNFTEEELSIIKGFTNSITSDKLAIVGLDREYTMILDMENGKIYMVKGIRSNFDEMLKNLELPQFISTTLLMFKDNIIFNGIFYLKEIKFGNDVKEYVIQEMEKAMKYYHL